VEEQPFSGNKPEKGGHAPAIWEEIKHRMQGAFQVLTGKSAAVDLQRLSQLEFSQSIIEDDLAYTKERDLEKGLEPER
jgi:hypothetical protein